jgi:Subtilase family
MYRGQGGGQRKPNRPIGDRRAHADELKGQVEAARDEARAALAEADPVTAANGFALTVEGWDESNYKLAVQSLDANGAKLLSVTPGTDQASERAVIWLPFTAVERFFNKIDEYATDLTSRGRPKNEALVANIAELRLAVLRDMWQEPEQFPDSDEERWWEVWLARFQPPRGRSKHADAQTGYVPGPGDVLRAVARERGWPIVDEMLAFPDNVVALVRTTATGLATLLTTSAVPSELHRARVASEFLDPELGPGFLSDMVNDLKSHIEPAEPDSASVCVLDTGVLRGHPLLEASVDHVLSALPDSRPQPAPDGGHGTQMAGLALFGDLERQMHATNTIALRHRLESVKILRANYDSANDPEMYGTITATAAASIELAQQRRRAFSLAVTTGEADGCDGSPTSWSASIDALAFGTDIQVSNSGIELLGEPDPRAARLFMVSAGNIRDGHQADHLALCDTQRVQNPAQAWNVLTVGAYTEKVTPPSDAIFQGWTTVAPEGDLSPYSRTSMRFDRGWPIKPDIVLEGGNLLANASGTQFDDHDVVRLLTTSSSSQALLTTVNATSAATAQAGRLAAVAMEQYPSLWPETVRGLLVHAAEWTPAMLAHFKDAGNSKVKRVQLLRRYGWGVPTEERVLNSGASSVTLMVQDEFRPFEPKNSGLSMRAFRLHRLPWPQEQLRDLYDANVRLRVTLSYFVEPNPSSRGWEGRYRYASHGLRFDVKQSTESLDDFERRLSNMASQEETDSSPARGRDADKRWYVGVRGRNSGSLHGDIWEGTGAELAESGYIGIIPVGGWWKDNNRRDRAGLPVRYALLVSLHTDAVAADIYTPIATQIGIPVSIET